MGFSERLKKASLVGAFFVSVALALPVHALCPAPQGLELQRVAQVIDGDTLRLDDGRSVRMIGLNTPERGRKGRSAEPFAEQATRNLRALVEASEGRVFVQPGAESHDRYGRLLAHVYDSRGGNLEAEQLLAGLGYFVAAYPNAALVACHQAAERQAREAHLGLWRQAKAQRPEAIRQGGFALIRGRVMRVERNRGGVWLELDGPMVLQVSPRQLAGFDVAALRRLEGRDVEVRGWVVDRQGRKAKRQARWLLRLTHPAMLEVR
ncbi:MAG TPA: nuclease [Pseudomonas sp.]|uniref:thermonuclease family protein n=1 Tax=Stutzerimonas balearica TaxID=74829 RepID=UPI000C607C8A|nr:nuclease [Pseudomonas sp.]HAF90984.1 nuclease [Pseudomonas sp.]